MASGLESNYSYSEYYNTTLAELILRNKDRCYFFAAYNHLVHVETHFKDMLFFAPITYESMGSSLPRQVTDEAFLFQCSACVLNQTKQATEFIKAFEGSGLDFFIFSTDISRFNHPRNLRVITREHMKILFASLSVMYYASKSPRHLPYSPLEPMQSEMPVVFLEQGMLDKLLPYPESAPILKKQG